MQPARSVEDYMVVDGDDSSNSFLNFPPTEICRMPSDQYLEQDTEKMRTFLYPVDVPRRNYQFEIVQQCLKQNTLVCLPTGSGKTFIASVVIMNFYRWFPKGIIIFCAPTRTLVDQQVVSCNQFTTIPQSEVTIFTGSTTQIERKTIWEDFRVIYATPQTIQFQLEKGKLDPTKICLIVFDEAHHARAKHPYCVIVRKIAERNGQFRIVGLSATPGTDQKTVQAIIFNLMISKIMYKDDTDLDIQQYKHSTEVEIITVPVDIEASSCLDLINRLIAKVIEPIKAIFPTADPQFITKGSVFGTMEKIKRGEKSKNFYLQMNILGLAMSLTSIKERITLYGTRCLEQCFNTLEKKKDTKEKLKMMSSQEFVDFKKLCHRARTTVSPKLARLTIILEDFFREKPESRCIVFVNLREVATDIEKHLKNVPSCKVKVFTGKNSSLTEGQSERTQQAVVNLFKKGKFNVIVATCVAEEGLDIGEVDLIICYDVQKSPLRTVQRMGRTGRKREGKVIFLVSEGYEEQQLKKAMNKKTDVQNMLTKFVNSFVYYKPFKPNIPIPDDIRCIKLTCGKKKQQNAQDIDSLGLSDVNVSNSTTTDDEVELVRVHHKTKVNNKPVLSELELMELHAVMGNKMRYRKVKYNMSNAISGSKIKMKFFSHSAESLILNSFAVTSKEEIPDAIEDAVSKLFGETKESDNKQKKNKTNKEKNPFASSSSDDEDSSANKEKTYRMDDSDDSSDNYDSQPCIRPPAFSYHRLKEQKEQQQNISSKLSFLSDSDNDSDENNIPNIVTNQNSYQPPLPPPPIPPSPHTVSPPYQQYQYQRKAPNPPQIPQNPQHPKISFLSDSDSDDSINDQELEKIIQEAEKTKNSSTITQSSSNSNPYYSYTRPDSYLIDDEPDGFGSKIIRQSSTKPKLTTPIKSFLSSDDDFDYIQGGNTTSPNVRPRPFSFISDSD